MFDFAKLSERMREPSPLVPQLVIAVTGHRPPKLSSDGADGYRWDNPVRVRVRERVEEETRRLIAAYPPLPCTCRSERRRDPACPLGREVPDHPCTGSMRAAHIDSHLRKVAWAGGRQPDRSHGYVLGLSGVALGADQDACGVWLRMGVPYVAVVPFPGHEERWPKESQRVYRSVLAHAAGVVQVSAERPKDRDETVKMLLARNDWLLIADELIAVWDGSSDGGTAGCVRSWQRIGKRATVIDPSEIREQLEKAR